VSVAPAAFAFGKPAVKRIREKSGA